MRETQANPSSSIASIAGGENHSMPKPKTVASAPAEATVRISLS